MTDKRQGIENLKKKLGPHHAQPHPQQKLHGGTLFTRVTTTSQNHFPDEENLLSQSKNQSKTTIRIGVFIAALAVILVIICAVIYMAPSLNTSQSSPEAAAQTVVEAMLNADAKGWCEIIEPRLKSDVEKTIRDLPDNDRTMLGIHNNTCEEYATSLFSILDSQNTVTLNEKQTSYTVIRETNDEAVVRVHLVGKGLHYEDTDINLVKLEEKWYLKMVEGDTSLPGLSLPNKHE
ncbi:MAG: hypothetical protein Q4P66_07190 [Actinomycetaceae bacterium]|nr:hypothetical protein [Actinomycetaceae bacterium]